MQKTKNIKTKLIIDKLHFRIGGFGLRNLFVVHTPYHLILSAGIVRTYFPEDYNILIISRDFDISESILVKVNSIFDEISIVNGDFDYKKIKGFKEVYELVDTYKKIYLVKKFILRKHKLKNLLIFNNYHVLDKKIMQLANEDYNYKIIYVEDGLAAYTDGLIIKNSMLYKLKWKIKKYLFNLGKYGGIVNVLGDEPYIKECRVLFPDLVNDALKNKNVIEISETDFRKGIFSLYDEEINSLGEILNSIVILLDLSTNIRDLNTYCNVIESIISIGITKKAKIYIKYHPRESNSYIKKLLDKYELIIEINKEIPSEVVLYNCEGNVYLISTNTTSFLTSKKLSNNVKSVSIIDILEINNSRITIIYKQVGVEFPKDLAEIERIVQL